MAHLPLACIMLGRCVSRCDRATIAMACNRGKAVAQPTTPRLAALAAEPVAAAELVQAGVVGNARDCPCKNGLQINGDSLGFHPLLMASWMR